MEILSGPPNASFPNLESEPAELAEVSSLKLLMESYYNYKKIGIDYL